MTQGWYVLVSAAGIPVESACRRRDHPPANHLQVVCLCNGAAIKLRQIEQACGCSTVRGRGGLKICVLLSAAGTPVESACRRRDYQPATIMQVVCRRLQWSRHQAPKDRASMRVLHGARRRRTQGL